ncbi:MAG TPA: MATE family efflux transporter, partial [Coprococcus sp.]|nr:MATE family efflux transporter [Coprococcus sp.]
GKATLISALRQGVCFIPLVFILPRMYGVDGVAFVQAAADVLAGIVSAFYLLYTNEK